MVERVEHQNMTEHSPYSNLLGLVTYLDWVMILVTTLSCISLMMEDANYRITNEPMLQVSLKTVMDLTYLDTSKLCTQ